VLQPAYSLSGGILRAKKHDLGIYGHIVSPASFMVLRDEVYRKRKISVNHHAEVLTSFPCTSTFFQPYLLQDNAHFSFFLYSSLPDLYVFQRPHKGEMVFYQEVSTEGYIVFRPPLIELRGERSCAYQLWQRLLSVYSLWLHCGQPSVTQYHFEMQLATGMQWLSLHTSAGVLWPFA